MAKGNAFQAVLDRAKASGNASAKPTKIVDAVGRAASGG